MMNMILLYSLGAMTVDENGAVQLNGVQINDKALLPQFASNSDSKSYNAITSNKDAAFNVFKYAADNSNVEWSMSGFKENGNTKFFLNTEHSRHYAETGASNDFFKTTDMIFNVHSHSREDDPKGGSGYI